MLNRLRIGALAIIPLVGIFTAAANGQILFDNGSTIMEPIAAFDESSVDSGAGIAGFLLDNGSVANGSGRTVSGADFAGGWEVYQSFTTAPEGWHVTSVGIDGWTFVPASGLGLNGTFYADVGGLPDRGNPLFSGETYHFPNNPFGSNWQDESWDVNLAGNTTYWFGTTANERNSASAIFMGVQGDPSTSWSISQQRFFNAPATALRIDGEVIPEPSTALLLGLGVAGLTAVRRRR